MAGQSDEKIKWMYDGPKSIVNREDYLMGKKIDKNFELYSDVVIKDKEDDRVTSIARSSISKLSRRRKKGLNDPKIGNLKLTNIRSEDPLVTLKIKEEKRKRQLLENPLIKMRMEKILKREFEKRVQEPEEESSTTEKTHKKKRKKDKDGYRSASPVEKRNRKHSATSDSSRKHRKRHDTDSEEERKPRKRHDSSSEDDRKYRKRHDSEVEEHKPRRRHNSDSEVESRPRKKRHDSGNDESARRPSTSKSSRAQSHRRRHDSGDEVDRRYRRRHDSGSPEDRKPHHRHDSTRVEYKKRDSDSQPQKRSKLSQEEMEARRREMMSNVEWRNQARETNLELSKQKLKDELETGTGVAASFLRPMMNAATDSLTLDKRLQVNRGNLQRSHDHMQKAFARK